MRIAFGLGINIADNDNEVFDVLGLNDVISVSDQEFDEEIILNAIALVDSRKIYVSKTKTDTFAVLDSVNISRNVSKVVSDTLSVSDAVSRSLDSSRSGADSISAVDLVQKSASLARSLSDGISATDAKDLFVDTQRIQSLIIDDDEPGENIDVVDLAA